ncbi:hypothetical protein [uncultured Oscillibacter sp.]|uniref:hypothetical protein n=1 Tax=uncultured Oscillibacter sp. TaxID=876091 RepID=UPI0026352A12|nr:hypothetical protein [uncultured Oscillibacter sp.]
MDADTLSKILNAEIGEIKELEEICPGVFYAIILVDMATTDSHYCEYYIVCQNATMISLKARAYGQELLCAPKVWAFPLEEDAGGWRIVKYEVHLYLHKKGILLDSDSQLRDDIAFGREFHPDYFGSYPLPSMTPWGAAICYIILDTGISWIITEQKEEALCVCYPMLDELSDYAQCLAVQSNVPENSIPDYLLYFHQKACVPIYELLPLRHKWQESGLITLPQLMNAIYLCDPQYVLNHNLMIQGGLGFSVELLLKAMGICTNLQVDESQMISLSPNSDTDYLHIEKILTLGRTSNDNPHAAS